MGVGEDSDTIARRACEDDWTSALGGVGGVASGGGEVSGNGRYSESNIDSVGKDGECRERPRHSFLQSVWLVVFDAAQCLEAELLQQRRHVIFAVRCSHLRRRPPVPIKLPHVDVQRLVQILP